MLANEPLLLSSCGICRGLSGGPASFVSVEKKVERAEGSVSDEVSSKLRSMSSCRVISRCILATAARLALTLRLLLKMLTLSMD
jgi:hypothetical protein